MATATTAPDFAKLAGIIEGSIGKNAEQQDVKVWLDSGYLPLNKAVSGRYTGGLPGGRIVEIFGPESSGKTWLATQLMIAAQRAGGIAAFADHERSFKLDLAVRNGLDNSPGRWIYRKPKTYEDSLDEAIRVCRAIREAKVIPHDAPIVWVFDSLASMIPAQMLEKGAKTSMNDTTALSRLTSTTFKVMAQVADDFNVLFVFLNQIRMKPGVMYGDPTTTPGGNAPKFYASVRIQLGATRLMKGEGDAKEMIGSEVTARCYKNKVSRPFMKCKWRFLFNDDGSGRFALAESLVEFAADRGILGKTSGRVLWTDGKSYWPGVLAKKIEEEGLIGELNALIAASDAALDEEPEEEIPDDLAPEA